MFNSMIFVSLFFALFLGSQLLLKKTQHKNIALLICSLLFYFWNGPGYVLLLVATTAITWLSGLLIQTAAPAQKKPRLVVSLVLLLGLVAFFRYRGFFLSITHRFLQTPEVVPQLVLPLGIAYYTLQLISYLLDIARGSDRAEPSFQRLMTFSSLFHLALGGPVIRYRDIRKPLLRRRTTLSSLSSGISRFSIGLAKKVILADTLLTFSDNFLTNDLHALSLQPALALWAGLLAYGLGFYLTLSAYADMAIGLGKMCGLSYPEHFDYPLTAYSIGDFWSKWQITMIQFFTDYLHDPLGNPDGSPKKELPAMFGVWILIGLWLGPSLSFFAWAMYFFVLLALENYVLWNPLAKLSWNLRRIITLILVLISFLPLRCVGTGTTWIVLKGLLGFGGGLASTAVLRILGNNLPILVLGLFAVTPFGKHLRENTSEGATNSGGILVLVDTLWEALHPVILLILSAMAMTGPTSNPFLFFQF